MVPSMRCTGEGIKRGKKCAVVDCDLKTFFDTVDHGKLMRKLCERVADQRLLRLILKYLKAGVITPKGDFEETREGVPQGGPLSPLMANVLLDELDHELEERGHDFVRYADDFVIMCKSLRAGRRIMQSIQQFLKEKLKLIVNETKSRVVKLAEASFLGFQIIRRRVCWTEKSLKKFKGEIMAHHPTNARSLAQNGDRRSQNVPSRSNQLLRNRNQVWRNPGTRCVATSSHEALLLETVG